MRLGGTEVLLAVRAEGELGGGDTPAAREPRLEVVVELAASVAAARDDRVAAEARTPPDAATHAAHHCTCPRCSGRSVAAAPGPRGAAL